MKPQAWAGHGRTVATPHLEFVVNGSSLILPYVIVDVELSFFSSSQRAVQLMCYHLVCATLERKKLALDT